MLCASKRPHTPKSYSLYPLTYLSIGNLVHANFAGHFFQIPLKSAGGGSDAYTEEELYDALANLFAYVFLDLDPVLSFERGVVAGRDSKLLGQRVTEAVSGVQSGRFFVFKHRPNRTEHKGLSDFGVRLVERLSEGGKSVDEVTWTVIPTAAAAVATQAQGVRGGSVLFPRNCIGY